MFISIMAEWDVEENGRIGLFWSILTKSYWIFSFPINILFWIFDYKISETFILIGLTLNTLSLSILIERLFYILKKAKIPTRPNTYIVAPNQN
jgi:hypothetical protein